MRLVHLSDLHLGYRQYQRLTPGGVNQREADVATTFRAVIDRVIGLRPDLILVAGDVFHTVRPTNQAILHAFLQFARLVNALPDAIVVVIAGNHDTPRSSETGGILQLLAQLGLYVVDTEPRRLAFPERDLSILAVPDVTLRQPPALLADPDLRLNVLVMHGEMQGVIPGSGLLERAAVQIPHAALHAPQWDYIALGHYHVMRAIAPNVYYSGSIDYTSVNAWSEQAEEHEEGIAGKGFIERDLETGAHTFHPVPTSRPLIDFPPILAHGLTAPEIDARIRAAIDSPVIAAKGGIDDKIVRLIVRDVSRAIARELDHKAIRDYKRRALNFNLDIRPPERRAGTSGAPGGGRRLVELKEIVREKLAARPLDPDIDRAVLVDRAIAYIEDAQAIDAAQPALVDT
jgi:hypothetical protein